MSKKKNSLPFDRSGGTLVINRRMLNSDAYTVLKPYDKVLLLLLQEQWRNDRPVAYGVREAAAKIPCDEKTAVKSFIRLFESGFIVMAEESLFNSRTGSKAREWRLTWMPHLGKAPTKEWEQWTAKK